MEISIWVYNYIQPSFACYLSITTTLYKIFYVKSNSGKKFRENDFTKKQTIKKSPALTKIKEKSSAFNLSHYYNYNNSSIWFECLKILSIFPPQNDKNYNHNDIHKWSDYHLGASLI